MKKTETTSTVLLKHHLKALRLPTVLAECEKVAQQCATDNVDHLGFLLQLCELELTRQAHVRTCCMRHAPRTISLEFRGSRGPSNRLDVLAIDVACSTL